MVATFIDLPSHDPTSRSAASENPPSDEQLLRTLREKETLLQEMHHRVKNNLAMVIGLLDLQAARIGDADLRTLLCDTQNRVRSMALIHELLLLSRQVSALDLPLYVQQLARHLFDVYRAGERGIHLSTRIAPISVDLDTAIPFGLILNELLSNALKHAYPNGRGGLIRVEVQPEPDDRLALLVCDDGVGFPRPLSFRDGQVPARSLGMRLIGNLTRQLGGTLELHSEHGTQFRITFLPRSSRRPSGERGPDSSGGNGP